MKPVKERQVFLVSPLPSSGMTHIQRTITAHKAAHIWGDWSDGGVAMDGLARLWESSAEYATRYRDRATGLRVAMSGGQEIADEWIAELCPPQEDVQYGVRRLIEGACRTANVWGFCSHYTADHIPSLRKLWPDCLVIVAIRQPGGAMRNWSGYNGSEITTRALIAKARRAYAVMMEDDRESGKVLWVDWSEQENPQQFLDKIYKPLELTATPFVRTVAESRIEKHFHDPLPPIPEWIIGEAEQRLHAVYAIARSIAQKQMPQLIR